MSARRSALLVAVLAALYIWVGLTAQGWDRLWGVGGGLFVLSALLVRRRSSPAPLALLALGALPLAVATWWSLVTPVLAALVLLFGTLAVRRAHVARPSPARDVRVVRPRAKA